MKEARPANIRSLLLSVLILSSSAFQTLAYYHPDEGRWLSRDPMEEGGGVNLYASVYNNPMFYVDPTAGKPKPEKKPPVFTPPTPAKLAQCLAKCAVMDLVSSAYDKAFEGAKFCGKIKNHCTLNQELPSPSDVAGDSNITPDGSKWGKATTCLLKCLDFTGLFDVKTEATFAGGGTIQCNSGAQSVDYNFDVTVRVTLDPGGHVLKEEKKPVKGSCGGPLGKVVWCSCCQ